MGTARTQLLCMAVIEHVVFVASFISTFILLYVVSSFASAYLKSLGYDINDLILIGLEKKNHPVEQVPEPFSMSAFVDSLRLDRPSQFALAAGVVSVVFLVVKLMKPSMWIFFWRDFVHERPVGREKTRPGPASLEGIPAYRKNKCLPKYCHVCASLSFAAMAADFSLLATALACPRKMTFLACPSDNIFQYRPTSLARTL